MTDNTHNKYLIPGAIVIAGALVAGAVVFSGGGSPIGTISTGDAFGNNLSPTADNILPVSAEDHIRGDLSAPVSIVEFSDLECPFCNRLHPTLTRVVEEFEGEVKWVYRHFPLTSIHSRALAASLASECVAELGGNDAFWTFIDGAFANQNQLGDSLYQRLAVELGLSVEDFTSCYSSGEYEELVQQQYQNALDSGGRGTPFVVVINESGDTFPFSGALPYEQVRRIVEAAIASS